MTVPPWIGFRVDCGPPYDRLLTDRLAPWFARRQSERSVRRWFFLWYGQDGYHLRLRVQPHRSKDRGQLTAELASLGTDRELPFQLSPQTYDRTALAFGDTPESVLAELLHAATTGLALDLLKQTGRDRSFARRWAFTAAAAASVLLRAIPAPAVLDDELRNWMSFAERAARQLGGAIPDSDGGSHDRARSSVLRELTPRMQSALHDHRDASRAVALLRRVRARGPRGCFVGTHAMHMFCNEMGLGFEQEHAVASGIRAFATGDLAPHRYQVDNSDLESRLSP